MSLGAEIEEMRRKQPMRLKKATSEIGGKSGKCNVTEAKKGKKKSVSRRRDQLSSMLWRGQMK